MKKIFPLWFSLYTVWFFMTTEMSVTSILVSQMPNAKINLAAFGLSLSALFLFESPIVALISGAISLVRGRESFQKFYRFSITISMLMSFLMLLGSIPAINELLLVNAMELPPEIVKLVQWGIFIFSPAPFFVGYRRFYQGIVVLQGRSRLLTYCTMARLTIVCLSCIIFFQFGIAGSLVGVSAMSLAMIGEGVLARVAASTALKKINSTHENQKDVPSYKEIIQYYLPLCMSSMIFMSFSSVTSFFVAHGRFPIESLAVTPLVQAFYYPFQSTATSFQETVNALSNAEFKSRLARFGIILSVVVTVLLAILFATGIIHWWFEYVFELSGLMFTLGLRSFALRFFYPAIRIIQCYYRGVCLNERNTRLIRNSSIFEILGLAFFLWVFIVKLDWIGADAGSLALVGAGVVSLVPLVGRKRVGEAKI